MPRKVSYAILREPALLPYCDLSLNGLTIKEAIAATKKYVKDHDLGRVKINYRLRDAIFSRQRYWGEPFPVYYDADGMPQMLPEECLPLLLPEVDKFLPTETGEPPLGHAVKWAWDTVNQKSPRYRRSITRRSSAGALYDAGLRRFFRLLFALYGPA